MTSDNERDVITRALDDALVSVMAARTLWKQQNEALARGECLHEDAVTVKTMGGEQRLCPVCGGL